MGATGAREVGGRAARGGAERGTGGWVKGGKLFPSSQQIVDNEDPGGAAEALLHQMAGLSAAFPSMERQAGTQAGGQVGRHTSKQAGRHIHSQASRTTVWLRDVGVDGPSDKQGMGSPRILERHVRKHVDSKDIMGSLECN